MSRPRRISCPPSIQVMGLPSPRTITTTPASSLPSPSQHHPQTRRFPTRINTQHLHPKVTTGLLRELTPPLSPADAKPQVQPAADDVNMMDVQSNEDVEMVAPIPSDRSSGSHTDFLFVPCFDLDRARNFYNQTFGWHFLGDVNRPDLTEENLRRYGSSPFDVHAMDFFTSGPDDSRIMGALMGRCGTSMSIEEIVAHALKSPATSHLTVPDIEDAADRIEENEGIVKSLRFGVRGRMMDIGEFVDPEGNLFGLITHHSER